MKPPTPPLAPLEHERRDDVVLLRQGLAAPEQPRVRVVIGEGFGPHWARIRNADAPFWFESHTLRAAIVLQFAASTLTPWHDVCIPIALSAVEPAE